MTATVLEFKCPTCGHLLGEEEYKHSNANIDRLFEEKSQGLIKELNYEHDKKIKEIQDKHAQDIENEVNQILASITKEIQYENDKEKQEMEAWYKDQLKLKDYQIQQAKLQNDIDIEQKIKQATEYNDKILLAQYKQKETENELQHRRIKEENRSLLNQVEKLQKALDSVPPELRGTAGEIVLFDHLHDAFPKDEFILKKVGVKMADVIQTIVLGNGEKLAPPIAWDKKTDKDKISKDDIDKAKSYKIIHNTDFSVIVTSKGITEKDSDNTLIGTREGILLVHPSIVVEICKLLRSFIIEMAKHRRSNNGRASKQAKLYDHVTSAEYARAIKTAKAMKASLDEQQRREENYHKEMWRERKKFIEEWSKADEINQQIIDDIIQDKPGGQSEDNLDEQGKED